MRLRGYLLDVSPLRLDRDFRWLYFGETPDALRGRVTSIHILAVSSGPQLGDIEAASLASVIGAQASVISGGLLCLVGVAGVVRLFPELLARRSRDPATRVA